MPPTRLVSDHPGHTGVVRLVGFPSAAGGSRLVVSYRGGVGVFDPETAQLLLTLAHDPTTASVVVACLEPSWGGGAVMVMMGREGVRLWDGETGQLVRTLGQQRREAGVKVLALTLYKEHVQGRDRFAAAGTHQAIDVYDGETGALVHTLLGLRGHVAKITCLLAVEAADGPLHLLSGSADGTIKLWAPEQGRTLHTLRRHEEPITHLLHFVEEGRTRLVSADSRGVLLVWDLGDAPPESGFIRAAGKLG
jgi:hypothetical protein